MTTAHARNLQGVGKENEGRGWWQCGGGGVCVGGGEGRRRKERNGIGCDVRGWLDGREAVDNGVESDDIES